MDLNELLDAHQRAVMNIGGTAGGSASDDHADKVALYAARIRDLRVGDPQADARPIALGGDSVIYAGHSDAQPPLPRKTALDRWESEGGSLVPPQAGLPPGITMTLRPEYRVGPYTYSDLALAEAEHARRQRLAASAERKAPGPG